MAQSDVYYDENAEVDPLKDALTASPDEDDDEEEEVGPSVEAEIAANEGTLADVGATPPIKKVKKPVDPAADDEVVVDDLALLEEAAEEVSADRYATDEDDESNNN